MKNTSSRHAGLILAGSIAALLAGQPLQAANSTWDSSGSSNANWNTPSNWLSGVPGSTSGTTNPDVAIFDTGPGAFGNSGNPILIDSARNILGLTFAANAGSYFIGTTGGNALQLTSGGTIQIASTLATGATETIDAPLVIQGASGSYTFANNSPSVTSSFNFRGDISAGAAGNSSLNLTSANSNTNAIVGSIGNGAATSLAVSVSGAGLWSLGGASGNTYSGDTTIAGGFVQLGGGSGNVIPDGTGKGNVVFTPTTQPATLALNGFSETINGLIGTSAGIATIDNNSGAASTFTFGTNNGPVNFNGSIVSSGGAISLVKTGGAAGILSGTNIVIGGTTTVQTGGSLAFTGDDPNNTTGVIVAGGAGLSVINGTGSSFASLTTLNLGAGAGATALGLDVGTITDTLVVAGAATAQGLVNFSIGAAPGFSSGSYTLLQAGGGGLTSGGAFYAINGTVAGGFTYSLSTSDTSVVLNATATAPGTFFWTGDQSGSWATINGGNTNWEDSAATDPSAVPGPLNVVTFSSSVNIPSGPAVLTTLDQPTAIDSLHFNGNNTSITAASVTIGPGTGGTLTIAPAGAFDGIEVRDNGGTVSITAPVELGADQTWTVGNVGAVVPTLTVSGAMSGTGNLTKLGPGVATITGTNSQTGRTAIDAGTLRIQAEVSLGANPGALTATQLSINGGTLRSIAAFTIDDTNRGITLEALGGVFDTTGGNITVGSAAAPALNVVAGAGNLRKEGGNTLILNSVNTYLGGTFINVGTVRAGNNAGLGTGPVTLGNTDTIVELGDGVNVANTASVLDTGNAKTFRLLAGATAATYSGDITVAEVTVGNFRAQASAGGTLTLSGNILQSGVASPGLRVNEAAGNTGVVVLSGTGNTYGGTTEVRQGTLRNGASNVIPGSVTVNAAVPASPTATYDLAGNNETITGLTFGGSDGLPTSVNTVQTGSGTLTLLAANVTTIATGDPTTPPELRGTVDMPSLSIFEVADSAGNAVDLLISANVSGNGSLIKSGLGTMEMSGTNSYVGETNIEGGILCVTGSLTMSMSKVLVNAGGQLGGTGPINREIDVNGGGMDIRGIYGAGCSIGTQQIGGLTMHGNSRFELEIDTSSLASDLTLIDANLTLDPADTVDLAILDLGTDEILIPGYRFSFITYDGTWNGEYFSVAGNVIADDADTFTLGANTYAIDYNDGGNKVSLVVVPEPATATSLLGGAALLAGLRRIRRRA